MIQKLHNTEERIFQAACRIFLLYGYHGSTFQQIAILAGVNKAAIHYYFRSKDQLYGIVVIYVLEEIFKAVKKPSNKRISENQRWFVITELYNNNIFFERTLKEFYLDEWRSKLNTLKELL